MKAFDYSKRVEAVVEGRGWGLEGGKEV